MKIDWKRKLTSRKFWMALAGFISGLMIFLGHSESEAAQVASLIMAGASVIAYCIGEGLADQSSTMYVEEIQEAHDGGED